MTAADALTILVALSDADCRAWVHGGWGVDALLREQTRRHDDLDVVGRTSQLAASCLAALAAIRVERGVALDGDVARSEVDDLAPPPPGQDERQQDAPVASTRTVSGTSARSCRTSVAVSPRAGAVTVRGRSSASYRFDATSSMRRTSCCGIPGASVTRTS